MKLGWIGLGDMGYVIIPRLLAAGHEVTGWNRTKSKADELVAQGMVWADTPRQVAAASEFVFSMVTDANAVSAVALGDDGVISGLPRGGIYLDMSTIDPQVSRETAAAFAERGLTMLDAPVSGSPIT
ncbi:MAG: NAD(P)-dependent oxidoreductase, partial [Acidimicrobiia bacterium]|nr:NAD(P)-dependent oxidoreductase [Acidimicrobiia bacterium]